MGHPNPASTSTHKVLVNPKGDGTLARKAGSVTFFDKVKGYYHTLITVVGSILALLNQFTPLTNFLPDNVRGAITAAILFLTAVSNFLVSNQQWVNDL
jgi:hypothetical protein